jgi:hypothetical protein
VTLASARRPPVTLTCARRPRVTLVSTRRLPVTLLSSGRRAAGGERRAASAAHFHDLAAAHLQATPRYSGDSDTYGELTAGSITTPPALLATSQLRVTLALAAIPRSDRLTPKALPVTLTVRWRTCRAKGLPATLPVPKAM